MTDPNLHPCQEEENREGNDERLLVAIGKCIIVGMAVGLVWVPLCFLLQVIFYWLRDLGILLLLILIPTGAFFTWRVTSAYLALGANRIRGAVALGSRYFFLGAGVGFLLSGYASSVSFTTSLGGAIGAMCGSLGGAFQGWLQSRQRHAAIYNPKSARTDHLPLQV